MKLKNILSVAVLMALSALANAETPKTELAGRCFGLLWHSINGDNVKLDEVTSTERNLVAKYYPTFRKTQPDMQSCLKSKGQADDLKTQMAYSNECAATFSSNEEKGFLVGLYAGSAAYFIIEKNGAADQLKKMSALKKTIAMNCDAISKSEMSSSYQNNPNQNIPSPNYLEMVKAKIRGNVDLPKSLKGNPQTTISVTELQSGEVVYVEVVKSSGIIELDEAVKKAAWKSSPLPVPKGKPAEIAINITYAPKNDVVSSKE